MKRQATGTRYTVTLPPPLEGELERVANQLHITKSEALRRALVLFGHAANAKKVELVAESGDKQAVLIK